MKKVWQVVLRVLQYAIFLLVGNSVPPIIPTPDPPVVEQFVPIEVPDSIVNASATAAIIAGAAGALSAGGSAVAQGKMNRRARDFAREQSNLQWERNKEAWNMQNAYNDPSAQMARLKAAGLNPNLIYGSSSGGAAGTADSIGASQPSMPNIGPVNYGEIGASALSQFQDYRLREAQIDQVKQSTVNDTLRSVALGNENQYLTATLPYRTSGTKLSERGKGFEANARVMSALADMGVKPDSEVMDVLTSGIDIGGGNAKYEDTKAARDVRRGKADLNLAETQSAVSAERNTLELQALRSLIESRDSDTALKRRQYKWLPVDKISGAAAKIGGAALGAKALGKFSKKR